MNRITIFHYHLLPGGVTNVIQLGAAALIRYFPNLQSLKLVCGREENTSIIRKKIEKEIHNAGLMNDTFSFEICIDPEIGYSANSGVPADGDIKRFSQRLLERYGGDFWWIHNYQLGKNPLFTAAVVHIAENIPEQKMLLQIHDFPECARYDNLDTLYSAGVRNPYPISESAAYALINGRDSAVLESSGIPANHIYLLNNPVENDSAETYRLDGETALKLKTDFYMHYADKFPRVTPEAKMFFYPVRTIRRKNALEAGLIAAVSKRPVNLVLSLPGVSAQEKKYSDICGQCFSDGLIPGIWGSGVDNSPQVPEYRMMLQLSDLILSSSVQEGFGYLFINSVQLGIPLIARDLDILDGIRDIFPTDQCYFYNRLLIPWTGEEAASLKKSYRKKVEKLRVYISEAAVERIKLQIETFGENRTVDFSFLSVEKQVEILKRTAESLDFRNEIHMLNETLMGRVYQSLDNGKYESDTSMNSFSLKTHSDTIRKIITDLNGRLPLNGVENKSVQQNLLDCFAEPQYMRLLYDF